MPGQNARFGSFILSTRARRESIIQAGENQGEEVPIKRRVIYA